MNMLKNKNTVITYTVDKKIQNDCYISVQNGEVVVRAPWYLKTQEIQELVQEKKAWILGKIQEYETKNTIKKQEKVVLFGEAYETKITYGGKTPEVTMQEKVIEIQIPSKYKKVEIKEIVTKMLAKMYQVIAEREIEHVMEKTRILLGIMPEDYEVKPMANILATCSKDRKISIHPNIVNYRREVIEYVVLHEFCHLQYKSHSKKFYQKIEQYIPNYKQYANEIKNMQY